MTGESVRQLVRRLLDEPVRADPAQQVAMARSALQLDGALASGAAVYGVTRGFGPLVRYAADPASGDQGLGLIHHLAAGQGEPLSLETTRLMLGLRLSGMTRGYSAVQVERWQVLADAHNAGFVPVVPSVGSVSASGDLIPLAHAALALAGHGEAWRRTPDGLAPAPAGEVLVELGLEAVAWEARDALAFVNGSSASLAVALENHVRLESTCWAAAALTGRAVELLGASAEPYAGKVVEARGSLPGHLLASRWIRDQLTVERSAADARTLQEPYSLRCAPQIIGSVWDHVQALGDLLLQEAHACSDNPVVTADDVLHAGNFHAIGSGLASDHHGVLAHQIAFLAERQLAVLVDPATNGDLPPLLAPTPGATSGLAGVQLAASAMVASIRQKSTPATVSAIPTNLSNQDIVPMSLVGALRTAQQLELVELVLGTLGVAVAQIGHLVRPQGPDRDVWGRLGIVSTPFLTDRPLHEEVRQVRTLLLEQADRAFAKAPHESSEVPVWA